MAQVNIRQATPQFITASKHEIFVWQVSKSYDCNLNPAQKVKLYICATADYSSCRIQNTFLSYKLCPGFPKLETYMLTKNTSTHLKASLIQQKS